MDFDLANQCAEEFGEGENLQKYEKLVDMCIPYLLSIKKRFGFQSITYKDVKRELAKDAVSDAIMKMKRLDKPFMPCLQNSFRDLCRKQIRITREHDTRKIIGKCDIKMPSLIMGVGSQPHSPFFQSQDNELIELADNILKDHEPFSKRVVYQKTRGSTYPEMSNIFKKTLNECKKVYWHDINDIREKLNPETQED